MMCVDVVVVCLLTRTTGFYKLHISEKRKKTKKTIVEKEKLTLRLDVRNTLGGSIGSDKFLSPQTKEIRSTLKPLGKQRILTSTQGTGKTSPIGPTQQTQGGSTLLFRFPV